MPSAIAGGIVFGSRKICSVTSTIIGYATVPDRNAIEVFVEMFLTARVAPSDERFRYRPAMASARSLRSRPLPSSNPYPGVLFNNMQAFQTFGRPNFAPLVKRLNRQRVFRQLNHRVFCARKNMNIG